MSNPISARQTSVSPSLDRNTIANIEKSKKTNDTSNVTNRESASAAIEHPPENKTQNDVSTRGSSDLPANSLSFGDNKPQGKEKELESLIKEIEPLLKKQGELEKSGSSRRLNELNNRLTPLLEKRDNLRQRIFDETRNARANEQLLNHPDIAFPETAKSKDDLKANASPETLKVMNALDYFSGNQSLSAMGSDEKAPKFDIENEMELVHVKLMSIADKPELMEQAKATFSMLEKNPSQQLTPEQDALLEQLGILRDEKGEMINYLTNKTVSTDDFKGFGQILDYQEALRASKTTKQLATGVLSLMGRASSSALKEAMSNVMHQGIGALETASITGIALLSENHLDASFEKLEIAKNKAKDRIESLTNQKNNLQSEQEKLGLKSKNVQILLKTVQDMGQIKTEADLIGYLKKASPEQKQNLNTMGYDLKISSGKEIVQFHGKPFPDGSIMKAFNASLQENTLKLKGQLNTLNNQTNDVKKQLLNIEKDLGAAGEDAKDLKIAIQNHEKDLSAYKDQIEKIKELRNNPKEWAKFSPDEQSKLQAFLDRSKSKISASKELLKESHKQYSTLKNTILDTQFVAESAKQALGRALKGLQGSGLVQKMMADISQDILKKETAHKEPAEESSEEVTKLVEQANQLARKLDLAPKPDTHDVVELVQDWKVILSEVQERFDKISAEVGAEQQLERKRLSHYSEQTQSLLDYTKEYLANLSSVTQEDLQRLSQDIRTFASGLASVN